MAEEIIPRLADGTRWWWRDGQHRRIWNLSAFRRATPEEYAGVRDDLARDQRGGVAVFDDSETR